MKYIKGFDTLRAIAILLVISSHLGLYHWLPENDYLRKRVWLLISGTTGVQVFFTLSGFLITRLLLHELEEYKTIFFKNFYIRRFLRLLPPLILFYTAIALFMWMDEISNSPKGFFFSFFYLYNFVPKSLYTIELGHTWSLALEEQYYLIWPFVLYYFSTKKIYQLIIYILVGCILAVYILPKFQFSNNFNVERWFIPAVAPIIIGSFFAFINHIKEDFYSTYFQNEKKLLLTAILLFLFPLYSPLLSLSFIAQSIAISILLIWIVYNQSSKLTSILNTKTFSYIGKISYGLYVYQGLFLTTGPAGEMWIQKFPQNILLTFVTAILSYHLLEKPILKFKKKFSPTVNSIS